MTAVAAPPMQGTKPRVGFVGLGWIGRNRMQEMIDADAVDVACMCDPIPDLLDEAAKQAPQAVLAGCLEDVLEDKPDGIVIATPSALHAEHAIAALDRGIAVFCQKPLGRTADEVNAVLRAARSADRLLGVDLSYRRTAAARLLRREIRSGALGRIFAADLVFHNAFGPDKPWFYDKGLSGGGCVIDLGVHLIDLALWMLDFPEVRHVTSHVFANGERVPPDTQTVEDYGQAAVELSNGTIIRIACSWNLNAGSDAVIGADFFGTLGGVSMRNVGGSFYDFEACKLRGTASEALCAPPDAWGGRTAVEWARRLARSNRYDEDIEHVRETASVIDSIYAR